MGAIEANANFNPATDIPSLEGKVIFITGGKELASSIQCPC
jgi:hypothetical protein